MGTFWRLLEESVILQGLLTIGFGGVSLYLWATGKPVPDGAHTRALGDTWLLVWHKIGSRGTESYNQEGGLDHGR